MTDAKETHTLNVAISMAIGKVVLRTSNIKELYFIEDIFSYSMTGKIVFNDDVGILEHGPLTGNETIHIEYGIEELKTIVFRIHKMQRIKQLSGGATGTLNQIEIILVHNIFDSLNYLKFSKSWKNKKIHEIVYDISDKMLGVKSWNQKENTNETLEYFYMPYWTPATALKWLLKRATGIKNNEAGFLFYESTNPKGVNSPTVNFVTLETLLKEAPLLDIGDDGTYVHESLGSAYISKILKWDVSGIDRFSVKDLGGSTLLGFDNKTKNFVEREMTYDDMLNHQTILGKKTLYPDISEPRTHFINMHENEEKIMKNMYEGKWEKLYAHQQVMGFDVMGHEERYCGTVIKVHWAGKDDSPTGTNKNYSGLYLIKSITHYFNPEIFPNFRQRLMCIKNGYKNSDLPLLVNSKKKRLK